MVILVSVSYPTLEERVNSETTFILVSGNPPRPEAFRLLDQEKLQNRQYAEGAIHGYYHRVNDPDRLEDPRYFEGVIAGSELWALFIESEVDHGPDTLEAMAVLLRAQPEILQLRPREPAPDRVYSRKCPDLSAQEDGDSSDEEGVVNLLKTPRLFGLRPLFC